MSPIMAWSIPLPRIPLSSRAVSDPLCKYWHLQEQFLPQAIRDWNSLTDSLISAAECGEDSVAKFSSVVGLTSLITGILVNDYHLDVSPVNNSDSDSGWVMKNQPRDVRTRTVVVATTGKLTKWWGSEDINLYVRLTINTHKGDSLIMKCEYAYNDHQMTTQKCLHSYHGYRKAIFQ